MDEQLAKREGIQTRLNDLARKRAEFIKAEQKKAAAAGQKDGFDAEVGKIIREQGRRKGIAYD